MPAEDLAARLPDIETLRAWWRSLAALDAVLSPEWEYRYFSYDAAWGEGEQMASLRNGSGDDCSVTFTPHGAYLRGFDHESELTPWVNDPPALFPGLLDEVPEVLQAAARDAAWQLEDVVSTTVSLWRLVDDDRWHHGTARGVPAGAEDGSDLFDLVDGRPDTYLAFAHEYYEPEQPLDRGVVEHVHALRPLTADLARRLNPDVDWDELRVELDEQGYPTA